MRSYTWLQAIRVLAGQEPGHPHIPSTTPPVPECDPPLLKGMLAAGVATVMGVPSGGDMHEPIPAAAWMRIRIVFLRSRTKERSWETVAQLPGGLVPDLTASRSWIDLQISEEDLGALNAAATRWPHVDRTTQLLDPMTRWQMTEHDYSCKAAAGTERNTANAAAVPVRIVRRYQGYQVQDMAIIDRVLPQMELDSISLWAALERIPDHELAGHGTARSKRQRIHRRIQKLKTTENF